MSFHTVTGWTDIRSLDSVKVSTERANGLWRGEFNSVSLYLQKIIAKKIKTERG